MASHHVCRLQVGHWLIKLDYNQLTLSILKKWIRLPGQGVKNSNHQLHGLALVDWIICIGFFIG